MPEMDIQPRDSCSDDHAYVSSDSPRPPCSSGMVRPEQAHLAHAVDDVLRVHVVVLEVLGVRDDLLVHELAYRRQDRLLHVGQSGRRRESRMAAPRLLRSS